MLRQLTIRDYTLIERLDLEFERGLTVLTGETGAGKSVILDALGLALGDRADSKAVRVGARRAEVVVVFDVGDNPAAASWLVERELDEGEGCFLRRVVNADGRSRAWINGQPFPLQELKRLGGFLVDLHGQHEHQSLLRRSTHRRLLDAFGGLQQQAERVQDCWQHWTHRQQELAALEERTAQRRERRALLEYQLDELAELGAETDEFERLELEQRRLSHAAEIGTTLAQTVTLCEGDSEAGISSLLQQAATLLARLPDCGSELRDARELLDSAAIYVDEARQSLSALRERSEADPQRLAAVESRLSDIFQLARKHRVDADALPALRDGLTRELAAVSDEDERLGELGGLLEKARADYEDAAAKLGRARGRASKKLTSQVKKHLHQLAMQQCHFEVALQTIDGDPRRHGREQVEFLVATIPGHDPGPLSRVASGGELSRISLAIQVVTATTSAIPTLVFDEVDVGIGGATAETVGRLLVRLAAQGQVLCVTHLAQVAARGQQHLRVSRHSTETSASATLENLADPERVEEIARMLSGHEVTDTTRQHARELLEVEA